MKHNDVSWNKSEGKWQTQAQIDGADTHLGYFEDFDEAVRECKAVELAKEMLIWLREEEKCSN